MDPPLEKEGKYSNDPQSVICYAGFDIVVYSDPVEVVFVYQRVGSRCSYDRVFMAPVNINSFLNVLKRASHTGSKWWVSTNAHSWLGSDNVIPGGVVGSLRTWKTCDAGSGFGEPTGRSSSGSIGPLFRCLGYTFGIPQQGILLNFPQSSLGATLTSFFVIRRGIRPRGISIVSSPSARRRSRQSPRVLGKMLRPR